MFELEILVLVRWGNSLDFQIVWSCRKALLAFLIRVLTCSSIPPCTLMIRHRPGKWRTLHILVDIFFLQDRFGAGCIHIHDFGLLFVDAKGYLRRYSSQSISLVVLSCICWRLWEGKATSSAKSRSSNWDHNVHWIPFLFCFVVIFMI